MECYARAREDMERVVLVTEDAELLEALQRSRESSTKLPHAQARKLAGGSCLRCRLPLSPCGARSRRSEYGGVHGKCIRNTLYEVRSSPAAVLVGLWAFCRDHYTLVPVHSVAPGGHRASRCDKCRGDKNRNEVTGVVRRAQPQGAGPCSRRRLHVSIGPSAGAILAAAVAAGLPAAPPAARPCPLLCGPAPLPPACGELPASLFAATAAPVAAAEAPGCSAATSRVHSVATSPASTPASVLCDFGTEMSPASSPRAVQATSPPTTPALAPILSVASSPATIVAEEPFAAAAAATAAAAAPVAAAAALAASCEEVGDAPLFGGYVAVADQDAPSFAMDLEVDAQWGALDLGAGGSADEGLWGAGLPELDDLAADVGCGAAARAASGGLAAQEDGGLPGPALGWSTELEEEIGLTIEGSLFGF